MINAILSAAFVIICLFGLGIIGPLAIAIIAKLLVELLLWIDKKIEETNNDH